MSDSPFPDVRWGSQDSRLRSPLVRFGATKLGSAFIRTMTPLDRRLLARTRGRYTVLGPIGAPTLLLTTTGAKSGQPRTTPLLYVRDGARLLVIGSNFGQQHHPAWTTNLRADPKAVVTIGGTDVPVVARQLDGDEREKGVAAFVRLAAAYAAYLTRTDRDIRVFALEAAQI
jgi:deazaflavin-dependent oxidoreductase (nitroreductase family)